jgi:hypothetical protein
MCVCVWVGVCECVCVCIYIYIYISMYVCIYMYRNCSINCCIEMFFNMYVQKMAHLWEKFCNDGMRPLYVYMHWNCMCVYIHMCVCMRVCVYIYVCVCVCIYIYIYISMYACIYMYKNCSINCWVRSQNCSPVRKILQRWHASTVCVYARVCRGSPSQLCAAVSAGTGVYLPWSACVLCVCVCSYICVNIYLFGIPYVNGAVSAGTGA